VPTQGREEVKAGERLGFGRPYSAGGIRGSRDAQPQVRGGGGHSKAPLSSAVSMGGQAPGGQVTDNFRVIGDVGGHCDVATMRSLATCSVVPVHCVADVNAVGSRPGDKREEIAITDACSMLPASSTWRSSRCACCLGHAPWRPVQTLWLLRGRRPSWHPPAL
jgi:hypothetical protein